MVAISVALFVVLPAKRMFFDIKLRQKGNPAFDVYFCKSWATGASKGLC